MRRYETVVLLNPELNTEQLGEALERYQQLVAANSGHMLQLDDWGQKPLAYPVAKHTRGHYSLLDYCGGPETVTELERNLRIDERCLKFLTVKTAEAADPEAIREELRKEAEARAAEAAAKAAEAEAAAAEAAAKEAAATEQASSEQEAEPPEPRPAEATEGEES